MRKMLIYKLERRSNLCDQVRAIETTMSQNPTFIFFFFSFGSFMWLLSRAVAIYFVKLQLKGFFYCFMRKTTFDPAVIIE